MSSFDKTFQESITKMIEISFEYVNRNTEEIEQIFVFCLMEDDEYYFNVFYKINGSISFMHEVNQFSRMKFEISDERMFGLLELGLEYLSDMKTAFEYGQREVPTMIKIIFHPKTRKLESDFSYELQFSFDDEKTADDCFVEWVENKKSKE